MSSHYTRGSVTTLRDFGSVLGRPSDTLFWALTMSWPHFTHETAGPWDHSTSSTLIGGKGKAIPSSLHTMLEGPKEWMQDGCKVYMDSYTASNRSCYILTWIFFKCNLLEVGLTQNRETMALQMLTTVGLFYIIMCEDPAWIEIPWNSIWLRAQSHVTSHYTRGSVTTLHDFGGVLGRPLGTFFWVVTMSWSRLLAHVWSGPKI